jgi:hypothetical protein
MLEIASDFNMEQIVQQPTRGDNILDLVLTTNPGVVVKNIEIQHGMSDYQIVITDMDMK